MKQTHVMHVIDSLHGGGAENSLLEIIPELMTRGVRTSIVTLRSDDGVLDGRVSDLGVARTRLRHRDPTGVVLDLRQIIRTERPDVLHTTLLRANLVGRVAGAALRVPVVTTLANQDYGPEHRANSRFGSWSVRAAHAADFATAPLTRRFHAVSEDVASVMGRRLLIPRDRIGVVYRGRNPARLGDASRERRQRVRDALSIGAGAPLVLSVGRLDRQKGVDTTIEAFRLLLARMPQAVLLVAGRPGNAGGAIRKEVERTRAVRFLGHREDVADLMCAADVLSFPSRWEGLGGTLVEAMALRLGIVASEIAAVAETIGDVGWPLVPPDNGSALADGLISVLNGGAVNKARKDAGQRRFEALFTAEAAADGMASFYEEVLGDSTSSA
jgi:glycosyltransferase involved in cell wall biosynthesis